MPTLVIKGTVGVLNKETNSVIYDYKYVVFHHVITDSFNEDMTKITSRNNVCRVLEALFTLKLLNENKLQKLYNKEIVIDIKSYEAEVSF